MTTYFTDYPKELQEELKRIANAIVAPGKGILAADESPATCGKRFAVSYFIRTNINRLLISINFRTLVLKTLMKTVVLTVNCCSPQTKPWPPMYPVSFFSTKPSTKRPPPVNHSFL